MKKVLLVLLIGLFGTALFAQNEVTISFLETGKDVQKYIQKNYEGFTVDKVIQALKKKDVQFTDVYISKGTEKYIVTFDKDDKFVKQATVTATQQPTAPLQQATPPPKPVPVQEPTPPPQPAVPDTTKTK